MSYTTEANVFTFLSKFVWFEKKKKNKKGCVVCLCFSSATEEN